MKVMSQLTSIETMEKFMEELSKKMLRIVKVMISNGWICTDFPVKDGAMMIKISINI